MPKSLKEKNEGNNGQEEGLNQIIIEGHIVILQALLLILIGVIVLNSLNEFHAPRL